MATHADAFHAILAQEAETVEATLAAHPQIKQVRTREGRRFFYVMRGLVKITSRDPADLVKEIW